MGAARRGGVDDGAGASGDGVRGWSADGSHFDGHTQTSRDGDCHHTATCSLHDVAHRAQSEPDAIRFDYPECGERDVAISRLGGRR